MPLVGDFAKLESWQKFFVSLTEDEFRREISGAMAIATLVDIDKGFTEERTPERKPWTPKKRPNGFKILEGPTKDLRHSFKIRSVSSDQFKITNSVHYFRPHQDGSQGRGSRRNWKLPRRQMVAEGNPLPQELRSRFSQIYRHHILLRKAKI